MVAMKPDERSDLPFMPFVGFMLALLGRENHNATDASQDTDPVEAAWMNPSSELGAAMLQFRQGEIGIQASGGPRNRYCWCPFMPAPYPKTVLVLALLVSLFLLSTARTMAAAPQHAARKRPTKQEQPDPPPPPAPQARDGREEEGGPKKLREKDRKGRGREPPGGRRLAAEEHFSPVMVIK